MNRRTKYFFPLLSGALLMLTGAHLAHASYIQLTAVSQLSATDTVASYSQPDGSSVASPFLESVGGEGVSFSTSANSTFAVEHQGTSFFGNFPSGTPLLYNGGNGPDVVSFSTPVSEFGVLVQSNVIAFHLYTVTFLSGPTTDLTYTISDDGFSTLFFGVRGTGNSSFNQIRIASDDNDFALAPVSFAAAASATPEPSSWLLCGVGLAAAACHRKRLCRLT